MKTQNKLLLTAASIMAFGITAQAESMVNMQDACKTFSSGAVDLPMAAISVHRGHKEGNAYILPVSVNWTNPTVHVKGYCKVRNGKPVRYLRADEYHGGRHHDNAGTDKMEAARSCKSYMADRFPDFPNAAFSVNGNRAYVRNGAVRVPVNFNWDKPFVEEKGECIVKNGIVKNYHRTSK